MGGLDERSLDWSRGRLGGGQLLRSFVLPLKWRVLGLRILELSSVQAVWA